MATNDSKRNSGPVFANHLMTVQDLLNFKTELLEELKTLISKYTSQPIKRWLKSFEVKELLHISTGTLHNLRTNGTLPFSKIGGVVFYDIEAVEKVLENHTTLNKGEG
ncbi:helix-turn-helix domain-containing protein [Mucilaginibacter flavus]|uniref:helix-turn-helix domain-containing protein n=1 Tax=Mucilaginibacter flavus TaxID=931504 RepID=UPI0025B2FC20|nr:helix-turn-helix domain-containing protein [Mucilaginibacter flavus]MDN3582111.1 helix-turn-helix domain-containing protein [Mucilaginibacter flavus]